MSYRIQRDPGTGLWIVFFQGANFRSLPDGNILSRAAEPQVAINLARQRVQQLNDPVTGVGPGTLPPLTSAIESELLSRAAAIEQQERAQFEASKQDQGPGTVSSGGTTAEAAAARDDLASTQAPTTPAQEITADGRVVASPSITQPSNAAPSQAPTPTETPAPQRLAGPADVTPVPAARGNQSPAPATQIGGNNLDTPDENTNLVSYIYRAIQVTSNFRQGKFTQELQGAQIFFPITAQQQQSPNPGRVVNQAAATADRAGAQPQGTVRQAAGTPGVAFSEVAAPSQFELEGFGDPSVAATPRQPARSPTVTSLPGSILESEGLQDPTAEQVPVTAPLRTEPPTTGTSNTTPVSPAPLNRIAQTTQGGSREISLQDQLKLARNSKAQYEKALAQVNARIARNEGFLGPNLSMRELYTSNIRTEERIIADLERQLAQPTPAAAPSTTVAPQLGAKDY